MDVIIPLFAAFLGAIIGGVFALLGSERLMNGTLLAGRVERQIAYLASLRAVERELDDNVTLLGQIQGITVWIPLLHVALDSFVAGDDRGIPDPVFDAAIVIVKYNTLVELSNGLFQAGQAVPQGLQTQLDTMVTGARTQLQEASSAIELARFDIETWVKEAQPGIQRLQQYPWYRRWLILVTNPNPLPPSPPGMPE
jgi:hypothetical protein